MTAVGSMISHEQPEALSSLMDSVPIGSGARGGTNEVYPWVPLEGRSPGGENDEMSAFTSDRRVCGVCVVSMLNSKTSGLTWTMSPATANDVCVVSNAVRLINCALIRRISPRIS